ncbi:MAG TPA: carbonic anhydrase [Acidothermaceae bacterium]
MSVIDELLENNRRYAETFIGLVPIRPKKQLAVVACMDSRIDVHAILGLQVGDAHVIRNGGGVISPDVIRSLTISQRVTGTREIILIHHTDCANLGLDEMAFKAQLQAEVGFKPDWSFDSFTDIEEDLRQSVLRLRSNPFIAFTDRVRGFIFDVATGRLGEVI